MNRFTVLQSLVILFCVSSITAQRPLTSLELKVDKTVFLVGEIITATVSIDNLPNDKAVNVTVKGKSNKDADSIIKCLDCSPKLFFNNRLVRQSGNQSDKPKIIEGSQQLILQFSWKAIEASKLTLFIETNLDKSELDSSKTRFIEIGIIKSKTLSVIAEVFGWAYFVGWLMCFYPQVLLNFQRKSCVGLNIDYCVLNFIGFLFYAVYNVSIYYFRAVQEEYSRVYPFSNIPVLTNDLVFSIHHLIVSAVIWIQCMFIYENGNQSYSKSCIVSLTIVFSGFFMLGFYVLEGKFNLLDYVYFFGFVKMGYTALKYIPQAYSNYKNNSTQGWSVSFNIFDIIGGLACLLQMFVLIDNYQDWSFITKNIAKTGIALLTLVFDVIFLIQHFCLYGNNDQLSKNKVNYGSTQINLGNSKQSDSSVILFRETNNNNDH